MRTGSVRLQLDKLDAALRRSAAAAGLLAVLEQLSGPLTDRAGAREQTAAAWAKIRAASGLWTGKALCPSVSGYEGGLTR